MIRTKRRRSHRAENLKKGVAGAVLGAGFTIASFAPADASIFTESTDFPGSTPGTTLPVGTTQVNGSLLAIPPASDGLDFFTFTGLLPGGSFELTAAVTSPFGFIGGFAFGTSAVLFRTFDIPTIDGTINGTGNLTVEVGLEESGAAAYTITLSAPLASTAVPEPATLSILASGLGIASLLRRRRKKHTV